LGKAPSTPIGGAFLPGDGRPLQSYGDCAIIPRGQTDLFVPPSLAHTVPDGAPGFLSMSGRSVGGRRIASSAAVLSRSGSRAPAFARSKTFMATAIVRSFAPFNILASTPPLRGNARGTEGSRPLQSAGTSRATSRASMPPTGFAAAKRLAQRPRVAEPSAKETGSAKKGSKSGLGVDRLLCLGSRRIGGGITRTFGMRDFRLRLGMHR
jgi:hypothetical protein